VIVLDSLGADGGRAEIGLPALGGLYFRGGTPNGDKGPAHDLLRERDLRNADLLEAVRHLATFRDKRGYRQNVDFRHLGAEELGSVYESLLELVPATEPGPRFVLRSVSGNDRKTTGSCELSTGETQPIRSITAATCLMRSPHASATLTPTSSN
jgi:hypothetical protein